jgi:hypothetical protein
MSDLEGVLEPYAFGVCSQNNVSNLNEVVWNFFAERIGVFTQKVREIVQQNQHHSEHSHVELQKALRRFNIVVLLAELEKT